MVVKKMTLDKENLKVDLDGISDFVRKPVDLQLRNKAFTITFDLEASEYGAEAVKSAIREFLDSKNWSVNDLHIKYNKL
jgi:YbbR domain-containing protein